MTGKILRIALALALSTSLFAAEVIVVNGDPPGVGFNDPAPATPVGGNPGTTVGEQALNVFRAAAAKWGSKLVSKQPILVISFFTPLNCTATTATLGAAGANWYFANIPPANGGKALVPNTWYPAALAEKLTRQDIIADPTDPFEIFSLFNSNLGKPGCLTGNGWYYGLDNQEPANRIDLLAVVLHEFGHGLGFAAGPTNANNGVRPAGFPSVWESSMLDLTTGKRWIEMTNAERASSARNTNNLVWAGQFASIVVPSVLDFGTEFVVLQPASLASSTEAQPASFGNPIKGSIRGELVAPNDSGGASLLDGCEPFPAAADIAGKIVLINRGTCTFTQKVKNAQDAGAIAAVVANNVAVGLPGMGGADPTIFIPSVGISQALGAALRASATTPVVALELNPLRRSGTTSMYPRLYAPAAFASGSSVSHWDTSMTPNVLMEPAINSDLTSTVKNPGDLTLNLLKDIGW